MAQEPHRDESRSARSYLSPGLVRSDEVLLRTLEDPDHLGPDGKVADAAISLHDIRFRGWSVDRKRFTSLWRIRLFHSDRKRRAPNIRRFYVLPILAGTIRSFGSETHTQDFVVIDTALWMHPGHADIVLAKKCGEGAARGFRTKLIKQLPPYVDATKAFGSSDRHGFARGMFRQFVALLTTPFRRFIARDKPADPS